MDETKSILRDVRAGVGLGEDTVDFDIDLIMHINAALAVLNQNGIGLLTTIKDESTTWGDLKDPIQAKGNLHFQTVPLFVTMSTKLIFDPPPPSAVEFYRSHIDQMLWRLKAAYEEPLVAINTDEV